MKQRWLALPAAQSCVWLCRLWSQCADVFVGAKPCLPVWISAMCLDGCLPQELLPAFADIHPTESRYARMVRACLRRVAHGHIKFAHACKRRCHSCLPMLFVWSVHLTAAWGVSMPQHLPCPTTCSKLST